jgi:hypothetical protein
MEAGGGAKAPTCCHMNMSALSQCNVEHGMSPVCPCICKAGTSIDVNAVCVGKGSAVIAVTTEVAGMQIQYKDT